MDKSPQTDAVDRILEQWKRERPDLDCTNGTVRSSEALRAAAGTAY